MLKKSYSRGRIWKINCLIQNWCPWVLFIPSFILSKALWSFGTKAAKKSCYREFEKATVEIRICIPEYPFVISFIPNKALWSFEIKFDQKGFVGTESEKYILELKISSWEYPYVLSFILNKTLWSCGAKFARKVILGTKLKRAIVKFRINTPEYLFVWTFILNKVLWNWGTKFAQNRYFRRKDSENNCRRQNQDPSIPLCIEFHFKQSTFKFRDQICPKNVFWGWHLVK